MNNLEQASPAPVGAPRPRGDFIVMAGLPGAGKSFMLNLHFGDSVPILNSDHVLKSLPGAAEILLSGDRDDMTALHNQAVEILNESVMAFIKNETGPVAYDSTGLGEKAEIYMLAAIEAGFNVRVLHVDVSLETAHRRNEARHALIDAQGRHGRLVPHDVIEKKAAIIEARMVAVARIPGVTITTIENNADMSPSEIAAIKEANA